MSTFRFTRRSVAASRFVLRQSAIQSCIWALCLTAGAAQANPLSILGGTNGVVDAVKRTANSVSAAMQRTGPQKPRITLPSAYQIERGMLRDDVIRLVGEPVQSVRSEGVRSTVRDIYKVPREGSCAIDQVTILYSPDDGPVRDISQRCGDVTSREHRSVTYSYQDELPGVFDRIQLRMLRDQAMVILGAPQDTRAAAEHWMFVDVYHYGSEKAELQYNKNPKSLYSVRWNGSEVKVPRISREELFERVARP